MIAALKSALVFINPASQKVRRKYSVYNCRTEESFSLIIVGMFMNFCISSSIAELPARVPYCPLKEQLNMKRKLRLSLTFSILAITAFTLSAFDNSTPQVNANYSVPDRAIAADGSDRTPQGRRLAESGGNHLKVKGLMAQDGSDRTPQGKFLQKEGATA